ncbi:ISL3 family transposase [Mycobacterium paragordonae]|uniref:ISL3 family transposase n=1 Tax=Mycobacterium paragordonae TaxID=1389713 RepID=A0AAJ1S3F0_9MYCO|nr:ISL3 family transposase [Mycobacterium paragordonae]MDP7736052.1 ISL3 family transposase [Mycobacterium paragordonae]MDP7739703.1 ISL3 family transposase [Mycobacterium paragordonae]
MLEPTSLLLGLEGLGVRAVTQGVDQTRVVEVITIDPNASRCPDCGISSTSVKERTVTSPRDIRYGDAPIILRWNKTRYRCRNDTCARASFTEAIPQVPARRRTTTRLRTQIGCDIGDAARSVIEVAKGAGVSWPTAHAAFIAHAEAVLGDLAPVSVLGIDETHRGKPRWTRDQVSGRWLRTDPWDTGFVDLTGDQGLLGQVEGRTGTAVRQWLGEQNQTFRAGVGYVVIDPSAAYASAVTSEVLPNAVVVVDHFHLIKLANDALTAVRRRVTFDTHGRRGRKQDPEWANRRRLLTARERLSHRTFATMWNTLIDNDPTSQILSAYIAKEELRQLLAAARDGADDAEIRTRLYRFYSWCANTRIPELHRLAATIETWWPAILAFLHTGLTNARTEGYNRLVKQVKRVACGFRNTENSRRRIRFHCTRAQRASTRFTTADLPG